MPEDLKFSSTREVDLRPALVEEFVAEVLQLPWAFISDGSTLADFEGVRTELELLDACAERYGMALEPHHLEMPLYCLLDVLQASRRANVNGPANF